VCSSDLSSSSHCRLARGYATFTGACSCCCITDWCSTVGMFLRLASVCVICSMLLPGFWVFLVAISVFLVSRRSRFNHLVELRLDLFREVILHFVHVTEFGKGPTTMGAEVIHAGNPVGVHGGLLFLGVLAPVALDLDDQVQRVVLAVAVVHLHDEVRNVNTVGRT